MTGCARDVLLGLALVLAVLVAMVPFARVLWLDRTDIANLHPDRLPGREADRPPERL